MRQEPPLPRKAFGVNDAMRERVRYLAGVGVPQDDIAKILGCAPKTLRKRFRADLDRGVAEANATMCGFLFAAAKAGNIPAIIFWLKTRAHWREKTAPDNPIPGSDTESNSQVVLVLPDNSRDPELTQLLREAQEKYFARRPRRQPLEVRTSLEGRAMQTDHALGTLAESGHNQLYAEKRETASAPGV